MRLAHIFGYISSADHGAALHSRRPLLPAVEHGDYFQALQSNAVGNNVWRIGHDKFASSEHASWPTNLRLGLDKVDSVENTQRYGRGVLLGVFSDELPE